MQIEKNNENLCENKNDCFEKKKKQLQNKRSKRIYKQCITYARKHIPHWKIKIKWLDGHKNDATKRFCVWVWQACTWKWVHENWNENNRDRKKLYCSNQTRIVNECKEIELNKKPFNSYFTFTKYYELLQLQTDGLTQLCFPGAQRDFLGATPLSILIFTFLLLTLT